jgi:hypothetical protein
MKQVELEREVRRVTWPQPGAALRARVLAAVPLVESPVRWWDRVWFSRAWRLSAAGLVAALVASESFLNAPAPEVTMSPATIAEVRVLDEVGAELELPRDFTSGLAKRLLVPAPATPATEGDR